MVSSREEFVKQHQLNLVNLNSNQAGRTVECLCHFARTSYFQGEAARMSFLIFSTNLNLELYRRFICTFLRLFYTCFLSLNKEMPNAIN